MSNPNQDPFDALLQAAIVVDKNKEDINTPKDNDTTTSTASSARSGQKKKNTPRAKKRSASTPFDTQSQVDKYNSDDDALIDTRKGVNLAPEGGYTPLDKRSSRKSGRPSKLLNNLDIQDIDDDNGGDELNESDQYIKDAIGETCPDDIAAEVHKRYPETKDREKAIALVISRIEHLEGASQEYNNRHNITNMSHCLQGCNGLQNITNVDCFMNSAMQILAHTDAITKYYLNSRFMDDLKDTDTKKNKYGSIAIELHKLLRRMHSGERNVSVKQFKCAVDSCTIKFPLKQQHDCHEFLLYLLKALHLSTQKLKSCPTDVVDDEPSLISKLFLGEVCSTLECIECRKTSTTRYPEYGLSLPIPTHAIGKPDALMRCLSHFFNTETLSRDNMINCGQSPSDTIDGICNTKRQVEKYLRFNPTPLMILTFKRNEYDSDTETTTKINAFLGFPLTLDMRSYVSSSDTNNNNLEYELQAVINHNGGPGSGHYYLYLKINGSWFKFDDSKEVTQVDESIVCSTKEANTLVYCRSNDVDTVMDQLDVRPRPNQASTRPPSASSRPERAARQKKTAPKQQANISSQTKRVSDRPPKVARQKKTPQANASSQQKKKRNSSNNTANKSSTAGTRKKRKTAQRVESIRPEISFGELRRDSNHGSKLCMVIVNGEECTKQAKGKVLYGKVNTCIYCVKRYTDVKLRAQQLYGQGPKPSSSRKRKAAPSLSPPVPPKSKRLKNKVEDDKKKAEDDKKRQDELECSNLNDTTTYFKLPLPEGMEIDEERTKKPNSGICYCRNKLCKKGSQSGIGKEGEKEMCKGCATEVRQFRRKLEFDKEFQLADDFDNNLADINAQIHDSDPNTYISINLRQTKGRGSGYTCSIHKRSGIPDGPWTAIPCDSALARQCLCTLFNVDNDVNTCFYSPVEDYFGKRAKESEDRSGVPSVKEFFQELAFWLFDKFYDKYKRDEDLKNRLLTILGYLKDPAQLHKLWEGQKFEYQDINNVDEPFDICRRFECLYSIYDERGRIRSTFNWSTEDLYAQKKRMVAAIDIISKAFERDVEHHSRDETSNWFDREDDIKAFKKWLKLQRDILSCDDDDDLTQLVTEFKRQAQATIDEIDTKREDATRKRQRDGTTHPAVAHERESIADSNHNQPPDYVTYMDTTFRHELEQQQKQFRRDIEKLQETPLYKCLLDAQTGEGSCSETPGVHLIVVKNAFSREMNTNEWFQNKFNGLQWEGICSFTNEEYENAGTTRPQFISDIYRYLLVRLAKECMMKGCSTKPSDYERAKSLYGFHLHHINKGEAIATMRLSIDDMSEEAKKNCVVFCAGCHNFKERDNVYSIPLNKLQNQLVYEEGGAHISGRQLVLDFDLVVVVLKLFVMGGFRHGSTTRCTPDILRSIFFNHFGILFDDTVDYDVDAMFNNLDERDDCKVLVNSAILGALKKRSKRCPGCRKGFMNISSFHSTVIHWDHTVDKEYEGADLNHKSIVVLLNEVGRYLGATCAFCHGEQPRSCKEQRTWGT